MRLGKLRVAKKDNEPQRQCWCTRKRQREEEEGSTLGHADVWIVCACGVHGNDIERTPPVNECPGSGLRGNTVYRDIYIYIYILDSRRFLLSTVPQFTVCTLK